MRSDVSVIREIPEIYRDRSSRLSRPRTETSPGCRLSYEASAALRSPEPPVSDGRPGLFHDFFLWFHKSRRGEHSQRLAISERNIFALMFAAPCTWRWRGKREKTGPGREHGSDKVEPRLPYLPWGIKVILILPVAQLKHRRVARNLKSLVRRVLRRLAIQRVPASLQIVPWAPTLNSKLLELRLKPLMQKRNHHKSGDGIWAVSTRIQEHMTGSLNPSLLFIFIYIYIYLERIFPVWIDLFVSVNVGGFRRIWLYLSPFNSRILTLRPSLQISMNE